MQLGPSSDVYDIIVIGGGVFGSSTAWEAARRGRTTLLLERQVLPSPVAASYGPSRKIRSTYLNVHYARLAREAMQAWRQIETQTGVELYVQCGNLVYTTLEEQPLLDELEQVVTAAGSPLRLFDERQLRAAYPQFRRAQRALLEVEAGFLRATACVEALQHLARQAGATLLERQEVLGIEPRGERIAVRTAERTYQGERVVLAAGGWSARLVPELAPALWQSQQGIAYVHGVPAAFTRPSFPPFSCIDNGYYGFPAEGSVGLKIAHHHLGERLEDPDFDRRSTPSDFLDGARRFLREDLGLEPDRFSITAESCMYNLSPSGDFLLDEHPSLPGLFLATAGSGHGFKFGSILGRVVVDRLEGVVSDRWQPLFSYQHFRGAAAVSRPL